MPIRSTHPPHVSATSLAIPRSTSIRALRARRPLPYPGYPLGLVSLRERALLVFLLFFGIGMWWGGPTRAATSAPPGTIESTR